MDNIPLRTDFWSKIWPANFPAGVSLTYVNQPVLTADTTLMDRFKAIGYNTTAGTFWLDGMKIRYKHILNFMKKVQGACPYMDPSKWVNGYTVNN